MATCSPFAFASRDELLISLQEGQVAGRNARWLKSHLILLGPQPTLPPADPAGEIPTLYTSDCAPSVRNFMIVAWNRLFRYPHAAKHVNGVVHGLHASGKSACFELAIREALRLFSAPSELADAVWNARKGLKWALESTWRGDSKEKSFQHRTDAVSSIQLLFNRWGALVGTRFRLHWLCDSPFLVDPFEEGSPTFALLHHFIGWIKNSERELDAKIVGRNLKRFVANLDIEPDSETFFRDIIKTLQCFANQEQFKQLLQILASIVQLQRVRANCDPEGSISLFNPDNLSIFAAILGIDSKEVRYELLTDVSKAKIHGAKDYKRVNEDLMRIGVVLYRSLVTWLFNIVNEKLTSDEFYGVIELFDLPGLPIQHSESDGSYDIFCSNVVNDVMTFSAFEKKNEDHKKCLMREGITLDLERPEYDDYLAFYFTQGKNDSLLSILSQEKTKKDHIQRMKKQIFSTFKTNQRIIKVKNKKDTVIGIRHASEVTVHYSLEELHEACSASISSGLASAVAESNHPVVRCLRDYRNTSVGLTYSRGAMVGLSEKLVSENSHFIYCFPLHKEGDLVKRKHVTALHLFNQCIRQISDFSEAMSHQIIFENYTHIFFKNSDGLQPSPETTRLTLDKLQIFGYISSKHVFICEADFYNLQMRLRRYEACVLNSQRFVRGFLARRKLRILREAAISYHNKLMTDFGKLRMTCDLFRSSQLDYANFITEETDAELLGKLARRSESARKSHKKAWGFCFILRFGKQVAAFPLSQDFYWIFAKQEGEVAPEKNYVNLNSYLAVSADDDSLRDTFGDGFYFRKTSNNSLAVKRKILQPMTLWSASKDFRRSAAPNLRERGGILPFKQFINVFDNERFKAAIAESLHTKQVSSRAIVGESIIPLTVGSLEELATLYEAPYCFVIVDLNIKDSLCLEKFNKEVRAEVKRLKKMEREGERKDWGLRERMVDDEEIASGAGTIHSLLIKMDHSLVSVGSDEKLSEGLGRARKREKWSRKAYEKRKMEKQLRDSY